MTANSETPADTTEQADSAPEASAETPDATQDKPGNTETEASAEEESQEQDTAESKKGAAGEARKYRKRAQEAEARVAELEEQLTKAQSSEAFDAERAQLNNRIDLMADALVKAEDPYGHSRNMTGPALRKLGINPTEMIQEDGTLNKRALHDAYRQASADFGIPYKAPGVVSLSGTGNYGVDEKDENISWADALNHDSFN